MLVLRRRAGESLLIGDDIEIEFLEISSQTVKLGIRAPKHVCILRKELNTTRSHSEAAAKTAELSGVEDSPKKTDS